MFGGPGSYHDAMHYEEEYGARAWDIVVGALSILGFLLPLLKSVAYQPLPFSWKPAVLSIFWNFAFPQTGHLAIGGSDTFWRNSSWWPQSLHLYS